MIRVYRCQCCGCQFESNEHEEECWDCFNEDLILEANFEGEYLF